MSAVSAGADHGWQPDRDQARRLLQEELSGREYAEAAPNPVLQWIGGVLEDALGWLDSLGGGVPAFPGWVLLVVLVGAAILVLVLVRPRPNATTRPQRSAAVLADRTLAPADHRRAAAAAAAAGDHDAALASWFRALVRQAEVRTLLDERPGRTATEAAWALGAGFPAEHEPLHEAAAAFNAVVYGERTATADQAEAVRSLDERLRSAPAAPAPAPRSTV
ncbi:MAG TPA: DUF4129 domain-containing protein, partial [Citricoccus sp.]